MIYLASPYTDPDPRLMEWRYIQACKASAQLLRDCEIVYCPIAHSHGIALHGCLDHDWAQFEDMDSYFLALCKRMIILTLPGYDESIGIKAEIAVVRALGKPIEYMEMIGDGSEPPETMDNP